MAIQQAGNQNALAQYQLGAAQRGEARDIARTNALAGAGTDETAVANALLKSGDISAYSAFVKAVEDRKTQRLTQQKTQGEISAQPLAMQKAENELFDTSMKQIRGAWGNVRTIEDAMAIHDATHRDPVINKRLQAFGITEQMGRQQILDAARDPASFASFVQKAQLGAEKFMEMNKPVTSAQDTGAGGRLISRPGLGGAATVVPGSEFIKQMAPGEQERIDISRGQLRTSQGQFNLAQEKFAFEQANPGFELKEAEDGSIVGVNKRTLQAFPVSIGGAAPAAPGAGMPGPRMPSPATQAIPGMTSVLDQPAAAAPVAGVPLRGKGTALTESQGNATAYGMRMKEANAILEPLERAGKTNTGLIKGVVGGTVGLIPLLGEKLEDVSGSVFNALPGILGGLSPEQQQVAQARINFITAILRKESGAAIGANEFATAEKNYFPKPGDDAATIAQKQQARKTAIRAMEIQAGPGARQMGGGGGVPGSSANNPLGLPGL
jgi:hypothetical protein